MEGFEIKVSTVKRGLSKCFNFFFRRDNKLFLFGEKMPQFVDMIKANAKRFKTMPIGPVGFHVELVKGSSH
jgi:hypothetical protein